MRYNGGKAIACKRFAKVINQFSYGKETYVEPFVGAAWVTQYVEHPIRMVYDINPYLIAMWRALQEGWIPPGNITEDEYRIAKIGSVPDHLRAFIGFGCSWGGKWFGGYAGNAGNPECARQSRDSLLRKMKKLADVRFSTQGYDELSPANSIVYCDPPYTDSTPGWLPGKFDHEEFWHTMHKWARHDNIIIVSSHEAPDGIECVAEFRNVKVISGSHAKDKAKQSRYEKLFILGI